MQFHKTKTKSVISNPEPGVCHAWVRAPAQVVSDEMMKVAAAESTDGEAISQLIAAGRDLADDQPFGGAVTNQCRSQHTKERGDKGRFGPVDIQLFHRLSAIEWTCGPAGKHFQESASNQLIRPDC